MAGPETSLGVMTPGKLGKLARWHAGTLARGNPEAGPGASMEPLAWIPGRGILTSGLPGPTQQPHPILLAHGRLLVLWKRAFLPRYRLIHWFVIRTVPIRPLPMPFGELVGG
jgi:hypothetical protein